MRTSRGVFTDPHCKGAVLRPKPAQPSQQLIRPTKSDWRVRVAWCSSICRYHLHWPGHALSDCGARRGNRRVCAHYVRTGTEQLEGACAIGLRYGRQLYAANPRALRQARHAAPATHTTPLRSKTINTTVLLGEDEPLMRERLQDLLQSCWPDADIVAVTENGNDAWDSFLEHSMQ